jgi:hypothetical protein
MVGCLKAKTSIPKTKMQITLLITIRHLINKLYQKISPAKLRFKNNIQLIIQLKSMIILLRHFSLSQLSKQQLYKIINNITKS